MHSKYVFYSGSDVSDSLDVNAIFDGALEQVCSFLGIDSNNITQSFDVPFDVAIKFINDINCYGGEVTVSNITLKCPNFSLEDFNLDQFKKLVVHETTHVVQSYLLGGELAYKLPRWFSEGMAVALSGQAMVFTKEGYNELLQDVKNRLGSNVNHLFLMNQYNSLLLGKPNEMPNNDQTLNSEDGYAFWGTAVAVLISENHQIDPRYAMDDGPFFKQQETEVLRILIEKFKVNKCRDFNCCIVELLGDNLFLDNLIDKIPSYLPLRT